MATFTKDQIGRMAEEIRERLEHTLSSVAANRGRIYGLGRPTEVSALTDAELRACLVGLYAGVTDMAAWLEESLAAEDEESHRLVRQHGATQKQIEEDILGAEGECLHRRHPERRAFSGKLRKLNEAIAEVRAVRVKLEDLPFASDEADAAGGDWRLSMACSRIRKICLESERGSEEQREAAQRLRAEEASLIRRCEFAAKMARGRRMQKYQEASV